jgi:hypothetical protein
MDYGAAGAMGSEAGPPKHSGYGIASTILGVGALALMGAGFMVFAMTVGDQPPPKRPEDVSPAMFATALSICCGGPVLHIVGLILGLVGVFQPNRHKLMGIIGATLNGLVLLGIVGFAVIAMVVGATLG